MQLEPGVWVEGPDGELIPDYESTFPEINEGQVVHGTVVRVDKDEVLVDIGYKSEGVIPVSELSIRRSVNPADEVSLGDEIDALVLTKEDAEGRLILSKKRARFELAWKNIEGAAESGEPVNGRVIEVVKGGLILDLGVRGFLPASLVDIRRVQDLDEFLGQELRAKVIELNRSRNNVVLSRRAVLEEERKEQRQQILDKLQPGDVVEGQISNIVDFGAFVDLDGMDGLIHISELSWSHVNHPSEVLEIGQNVQVKVLDIDRDRQRISLGLKQTQSDPWQQVLENYHEDDVVEGRVTKVVTFGAFVEILPGVEGLVHISELAQHHVENPREVVSQGSPVNVKIIEVDGERRRLSLSLKRVEDTDPVQPRADGGESVHERPNIDLSDEVFADAPAGDGRGRRAAEAAAERRGRDAVVEDARRGAAEVEDAEVEALWTTPSRPRPRPSTAVDADEAGSTRRKSKPSPTSPSRRSKPRHPPTRSEPAGRRRDHRRHRSGQERGAERVRAPRRGDGLERRDRPPPAAARGRAGSAVVEQMGNGIVGPDGEIDRGALATVVFNDRDALRWLEELLHPLVSAEYLQWREELAELPNPPPVDGHRGAAALRVGRRDPLRQGRRDHGAEAAAARALGRRHRRARVAPAPRRREGAARRLRVREHRLARGARRVRRVRDGRPGGVRRLLLAVGARRRRSLGAAAVRERDEAAWYERLRYPLHYSEFVRVHAEQNNLDPALLAAVIYQESKFDTGARSSSGAIGLMQLTPATARGIAIRTGGSAFRTADLYNPEINIRYGAWYLENLFHKYGNERLVLAAYNAGQGNVDRWRAKHEPIQFPETRAYVSRVEHLKRIYRACLGKAARH